MHDIVTDKSFDIEKSYEYILSIQVSLNGFSFSIVSSKENKLLAINNTPLIISSIGLVSRRFNEWIESNKLLQNPYKKIRLIVFNENFTMIPENFYSDELKKGIAHLLFAGDEKTEIAENIIARFESRLIFTLPQGLNEVIQRQFGEVEIIHPVKIAVHQLPKTKKENGLILLFDEKYFYIILYSENEILLTNSFNLAHANDLVYFVLTTMEQLGVSTHTTELFYAGKTIHENTIITLLKKYFKSIGSLPPSNSKQVSNGFSGHTFHQYLSLYN